MSTYFRLLWLALILTELRPMALGSDAAMAQTATSYDTVSPARHALLIGVNEYRSKKISDLKGAVNDVELAKTVLTTHFGFSEKNIETVTNERATRKGILGALDRLTKRAKPGDVVYIHYSGHGSQVTDQDGDEKEDGKDETLVPHDGRTAGVPDITDDEIEAYLSRLHANETVVVLDSCHSGTATRSVGILTRSIPEDTRIELYSQTEESLKTRTVVTLPPTNHILLTGAASNESALDGPIGGKNRGLFSYALFSVLDAAGPAISPAEIHQGVKTEFQRISDNFGGIFLPDPQFEVTEERLNRPLFPSIAGGSTTAAASQRAFVTVSPGREGQVILSKGRLVDARGASFWGIYPPGEERFAPGDAVAIAKVIGSRGQDAIARLEPASAAVQPGSRAIPLSGSSPDRVISVDIRADAELKSTLERAILERTQEVEFVTRYDFARFIIEALRGGCAGCAPEIVVYGATGLHELDRFPWSLTAGDRLVRLFSRSLDASTLKTIANPSSRLKLDVKLVSQPLGQTEGRGIQVVPASTKVLYRIRKKGEPRGHQNSLMLEIQVSEPSYITIVDIDSEGRTTVLFPNDYQDPDFYPHGRIPAGVALRIPDSLVAPNRAGFFWDYSPPEGEDLVQVFASTDLDTAKRIRQYISQVTPLTGRLGSGAAGLRSRSGEGSWAEDLRRELAQLAIGRGVSVVPATSTQPAPAPSPAQDWTAVSVNIQVAR